MGFLHVSYRRWFYLHSTNISYSMGNTHRSITLPISSWRLNWKTQLTAVSWENSHQCCKISCHWADMPKNTSQYIIDVWCLMNVLYSFMINVHLEHSTKKTKNAGEKFQPSCFLQFLGHLTPGSTQDVSCDQQTEKKTWSVCASTMPQQLTYISDCVAFVPWRVSRFCPAILFCPELAETSFSVSPGQRCPAFQDFNMREAEIYFLKSLLFLNVQ